jgi:MscS family membrane protein
MLPLDISLMLTANNLPINLRLIPVLFAVILVIIALPRPIRLLLKIRESFSSSRSQEVLQEVVEPDLDLWQSIVLLLIADLILLITGHFVPKIDSIDIIEFPVGLAIVLFISWLGYRLFQRLFKIYITQIAERERKLNEDLLIIAKWLIFSLFLFIIITIFSQTHEINIFGLIAGLGVGGVAIAFAAQKTLEQLLGGIVLYLDRPFVISDYIGLPDGTFGKVESIGLRSTKIRTSGKGTLMVVPNNYLSGINIENFTGASRIINIVKINFSEFLPETKQAFISQLILDSGIDSEVDPRHINVDFTGIINERGQKITQGQVKFLMPLAGDTSEEFRLQIIKIVAENIHQKLLDRGIEYEIVDRILIDSQISI